MKISLQIQDPGNLYFSIIVYLVMRYKHEKIQINYSRERLLNVTFPGAAYLPDLIP